MRIKVSLTEHIINQSLALHYGHSVAGKKSKRKLTVIPVLLLLISIYLFYSELQQPVVGQNFYMAMLYTTFAICYYVVMRNRMVNGGKKLLSGLGENARFEMEVDEEGLTTYTASAVVPTLWTSLTGAMISNELVLLYQADNSFTMFHPTFFEQGDFETFKQLTQTKVEPVMVV